jgi:hypothetical protein
MVPLTDSAQKALDEYLHETRTCLQGIVSVDADEVEQNITEHIENELRGAPEPVGFETLDAVLKKLGSPKQWVPEEESSEWRKLILRLQTCLDNSLAYLSLSLLILVFVAFRVGLVLLVASFCVARIALLAVKDRRLSRQQKWLLYPSLVVTYGVIVLLLLLAPTWAAISHPHLFGKATITQTPHERAIDISLLTGAWWVLLGMVATRRPQWIRMAFAPFGDKFEPLWANILASIGLIALLVPLVVLFFMLPR